MVELTDQVIAIDKYWTLVEDSGHGAKVLFLGTVRDIHENHGVSRIFYDCYRPMTLKMMERIETEVLEKHPEVSMVLVHRIGMVELKEASVLVLTSSRHRKDAYSASQYIMNRVKEILPVWKQEFHPDGTHSWVGIGS